MQNNFQPNEIFVRSSGTKRHGNKIVAGHFNPTLSNAQIHHVKRQTCGYIPPEWPGSDSQNTGGRIKQFQTVRVDGPPHAHLSHINIPLVNLLPPSHDCLYLLTLVDYYTHCSKETQEVGQAFISNWDVQFGVPSSISSDQGQEFTSKLWNDISGPFGITMKYTTLYNPQTDRLVEKISLLSEGIPDNQT